MDLEGEFFFILKARHLIIVPLQSTSNQKWTSVVTFTVKGMLRVPWIQLRISFMKTVTKSVKKKITVEKPAPKERLWICCNGWDCEGNEMLG